MQLLKNQEQDTKLTQQQKETLEKLYQTGKFTYGDLARRLNIPYNTVNRYMTSWKRSQGIIKPKKKEDDAELKFLRKFYIDTVGTDDLL